MTDKPKRRGKPAGYRAIRGISWPKEGGKGWNNVEPGKVRSDLPTKWIAEWLSIGAIEPVDTVPDAPKPDDEDVMGPEPEEV
jgi:hypothetical protein